MDKSQHNRPSNAVRKRRSSILKSQRPPRTPFAELEFSATPPTETAKSRRVSFSRRTGVAEFITNEATTTWRNVYEEHNKSDSLGNNSDLNQPRVSVAVCPNVRAFEQHFQDMETDFVNTIGNPASRRANASFTNMNITDQLTFEQTEDNIKLQAPIQHFELSSLAYTQHSKVFRNECTDPNIGETSGGIPVDFSAIHSIGIDNDQEASKPILNVKNLSNDWTVDKENIAYNPYLSPIENDNFAADEDADKDLIKLTDTNLDENYDRNARTSFSKGSMVNMLILEEDSANMQFDSEQASTSKALAQNELRNSDGKNIIPSTQNNKSKTILFDNSNLKSDMSVTQCLMENKVIEGVREKSAINEDICFADMSVTQVVHNKLYDYKSAENKSRPSNLDRNDSLLENIKGPCDNLKEIYIDPCNESSVCEPTQEACNQRKTIVLNVDDDLPNFVDLPQQLYQSVNPQGTIIYDMEDSSMQCTFNVDITGRSKTKIFDHDMSITQAVPTNIVNHGPRRTTLHFNQEDKLADMSMTEVIDGFTSNKNTQRQTLIFDNDNINADMSMTQAFPGRIDTNKEVRRGTTHFQDDSLSITEAIPVNIQRGTGILESKLIKKRQTIVFDEDDGNMSITQAIPRKPIILDNDNINADMSMTQAFPGRIDTNKEVRRGTTHFHDDSLSITEAIPVNIQTGTGVLESESIKKRQTIVFDEDDGNMSITQAIPRKPIILDNDNTNADMSMTQAFPGRIDTNQEVRRGTMHFQDDSLSITEAIPVNIQTATGVLESESIKKRQTIVFDEDSGNMSITQAIPNNFISSEPKELDEQSRQKSFIVGTDFNISTKKPIHSLVRNKRVTIVFENDNPMADMSITQAFPQVFTNNETKVANDVNVSNDKTEIRHYKPIESINQATEDIVVFQTSTTPSNKTLTQSIRKINEEEISIIDKTRDTDTCDNLPGGTFEQGSSEVSDNGLEKKDSPVKFQNMFNNDVLEANMIKPQEVSESQNIVHIILPSRKGEDSVNTSITRITASSHKTPIHRESEENLKTTVCPYGIKNAYDLERACDEMVDDVNQTSNISSKSNPVKSLLNNLLDMSNASMEVDEKSEQVVPKTVAVCEIKNNPDSNSDNDFIPIVGDSEYDIKSVMIDANQDNDLTKNKTESKKVSNQLPKPELEYQAPLPIEYKEDVDETPNVFETKMNKIKKVMDHQRSPLKNKLRNSPKVQENKSKPNAIEPKAQKHNKKSPICPTNDTKSKPELMDIVKVRPNFNPRRQSKVLSREDLLSNISMAQAALKNSSELSEECMDVSPGMSTVNVVNSRRQSVRVSREVIKTLKFEDEELGNETSMRSNINVSPLKKTAFGETSYMKENTKTPIPSYLKDVSDGMKQIMRDLVKPMADVPYSQTKIDKGVKNAPSTCSMHIQANLIASSQVDLNCDTQSSTSSVILEQKSILKTLSRVSDTTFEKKPSVVATTGNTIMFDPTNPLNNILLPGVTNMEVHKYDPIKYDVVEREPSQEEVVSNEVKIVHVATEHDISTPKHDITSEKHDITDAKHVENQYDNSDIASEVSHVPTETMVSKIVIAKDMEVNTVIAMKPNDQLLDDSSSLTLVDDALVKSNFDVNVESKEVHVKFTYAFNEFDIPTVETAAQYDKPKECRKRSYSPASTKKCVETTPKPQRKMQRTSKSPNTPIRSSRKSSSPEIKNCSPSNQIKIIDTKKRSPKKYIPIQSKPVYVHQVNITKSQVNTIQLEVKQKYSDISIKSSETEINQSDAEESICSPLSFASSKNQLHDDLPGKEVKTSDDGQDEGKWQAEFVPETIYSDFYETEADSAAKVKAAIRALPIMGTKHCQWDVDSDSEWSFLLLHSRIRIGFKFDQNTYKRHTIDTPVIDVPIDVIKKDASPVAVQCVNVFVDSLKQVIRQMLSPNSRGEQSVQPAETRTMLLTGEIPALLQKCAQVSRTACLWGRAMDDSKVRLAYKFKEDGRLSLKVANIPLRSVWEVTFRIEVGSNACPIAKDVEVKAVLAQYDPKDEVQRLAGQVVQDWGHVPNTLWKIFKFLKCKTLDSNGLNALKY